MIFNGKSRHEILGKGLVVGGEHAIHAGTPEVEGEFLFPLVRQASPYGDF